jgi:hypothetical protein
MKVSGWFRIEGCESFVPTLSSYQELVSHFDAITAVFSPRPQPGDSFCLCSFHGAAIRTILKLMRIESTNDIHSRTLHRKKNISLRDG